MVVAERWTSRDAFDLLYFVNRQGRDVSSIDEFLKIKRPRYPLRSRLDLLTRPFGMIDPGLQSIDPDAPQTMEVLAERMKSMVEIHLRQSSNRLAELSRGLSSTEDTAVMPISQRDGSQGR